MLQFRLVNHFLNYEYDCVKMENLSAMTENNYFPIKSKDLKCNRIFIYKS